MFAHIFWNETRVAGPVAPAVPIRLVVLFLCHVRVHHLRSLRWSPDVGNHWATDTTSHPKRWKSSTTPLRKSQISQVWNVSRLQRWNTSAVCTTGYCCRYVQTLLHQVMNRLSLPWNQWTFRWTVTWLWHDRDLSTSYSRTSTDWPQGSHWQWRHRGPGVEDKFGLQNPDEITMAARW